MSYNSDFFDVGNISNPWQHIAMLIQEAGKLKGPQGWTTPAAAAAAAAAEARAAANAAAEVVLSNPSSACATPMGAVAARLMDTEVNDTVAAAAALLELSTGRKRRFTSTSTDYCTTESEDAGSPPVQFKLGYKDLDADGVSDGQSDHTIMQGSPGSTAVSKQQRLNSPAGTTPPALYSPAPAASACPAAIATAAATATAAAAAAAAAVSSAGLALPAVELQAHQRRVQLHMIEQMLDATNTKFSTNNGVVAPRKFWPRLEGGDTAPTQLQVLVHPPSWSTSDYVSASLERLAAAVVINDAAAMAADDGSALAYAVLWKHYLEQTESDEQLKHQKLQPSSKGNLHLATAGGRSLTFGPYPASVVAGGSMMRIRGIKHNGELKLLINTPHTLVLREKLGAHMLRLHVVLNAIDTDDFSRQHSTSAGGSKAAGSALDGVSDTRRGSASQQKHKYLLQQQVYQAAAASAGSSGGAMYTSPRPAYTPQSRAASPAPAAIAASDVVPQIIALANEMAAAAAATGAGEPTAGTCHVQDNVPQDIAQAVATAMAALRRRQQEVLLHHAVDDMQP